MLLSYPHFPTKLIKPFPSDLFLSYLKGKSKKITDSMDGKGGGSKGGGGKGGGDSAEGGGGGGSGMMVAPGSGGAAHVSGDAFEKNP